jgi:hypothetical protein
MLHRGSHRRRIRALALSFAVVSATACFEDDAATGSGGGSGTDSAGTASDSDGTSGTGTATASGSGTGTASGSGSTSGTASATGTATGTASATETASATATTTDSDGSTATATDPTSASDTDATTGTPDVTEPMVVGFDDGFNFQQIDEPRMERLQLTVTDDVELDYAIIRATAPDGTVTERRFDFQPGETNATAVAYVPIASRDNGIWTMFAQVFDAAGNSAFVTDDVRAAAAGGGQRLWNVDASIDGVPDAMERQRAISCAITNDGLIVVPIEDQDGQRVHVSRFQLSDGAAAPGFTPAPGELLEANESALRNNAIARIEDESGDLVLVQQRLLTPSGFNLVFRRVTQGLQARWTSTQTVGLNANPQFSRFAIATSRTAVAAVVGGDGNFDVTRNLLVRSLDDGTAVCDTALDLYPRGVAFVNDGAGGAVGSGLLVVGVDQATRSRPVAALYNADTCMQVWLEEGTSAGAWLAASAQNYRPTAVFAFAAGNDGGGLNSEGIGEAFLFTSASDFVVAVNDRNRTDLNATLVTASGRIVVAGAVSNGVIGTEPRDGMIAAFGSDGLTRPVYEELADGNQFDALCADPAGNVVAVGTRADSGIFSNVWLVRYAMD